MKLLQTTKKLLPIALMLCFAVLTSLVSAQTTEQVSFKINFDSQGQQVNELTARVELTDGVFDPSEPVNVKTDSSWSLTPDNYTTSVSSVNEEGSLIDIKFIIDGSKSGSGHVAEVMIGLVIILDDFTTKKETSAAEVIDVQAKVAVPTKEVSPEITVYPNPATNRVEWKGAANEKAIVQVISPNGKTQTIVWEAGKALDVSTWARGLYILRFVSNEYTVSRKLFLN
ncbi:MAG: T9SS type A sorting domain-containing protein [Bacteroidia bacterium]